MGVGAGARARAQAFRTALRIRYKSSLQYLGTLIAVAGDFGPRNPSNCSEISDSGGEKKLGRATKGAMEERFWRGQLLP